MVNDNKLFQQIKSNNKQSFELLFRTYYAPLCLFARKYLYDPDECEEIVQAFFLKLWEDRSKISISTSIKSYLYSAVRNRCLNQIKHEKIKQEYHSEVINQSTIDTYTANSFLEPDLMEKIQLSIESLPKRRKEIFILSREHGLKYKEIAEKMGISIKTVEAQMGKALKDLRTKLKDYKHLLLSFLIVSKKTRVGVNQQANVKQEYTQKFIHLKGEGKA